MTADEGDDQPGNARSAAGSTSKGMVRHDGFAGRTGSHGFHGDAFRHMSNSAPASDVDLLLGVLAVRTGGNCTPDLAHQLAGAYKFLPDWSSNPTATSGSSMPSSGTPEGSSWNEPG